MRRLLFMAVSLATVFCAGAADGGWRIRAERVDTMKKYVGAAASNGEIGLTIGRNPFEIKHIFCATAYENGTADDISKLLPSINPFAVKLVGGDGVELRAGAMNQTIDMHRAVHVSEMAYDGMDVSCEVRALRSLPHAGMVRVRVKAETPVEFFVVNSHDVPDILATDAVADRRTLNSSELKSVMTRTMSSYNRGVDHMVAMSVFAANGEGVGVISADTLKVKLGAGGSASFDLVGVICTSSEYKDPWNEAERQLIYALNEGSDRLIERHDGLWADLWKNEVVVAGDEELTRQARFALYNLYGALSPGSRRSVAPLGLTGAGYYGHVFWDAETWMFPVVLELNPRLAKDMISYRIDRLDAARARARAHGYSGAMFPWESDADGEESTPTFALTGPLEHHITADVANAAWDYFEATADTVWLREEGYPLIKECADFWVSRVSPNADGSYSIKNVVGADEYAIMVDDNAFTNGAARRNLQVAAGAAAVLGRPVDPMWLKIADGMRFVAMPDGVTAEYDGYDGAVIKQADVNLLAYPLGVITDPAQIRRDLDYYSERIDKKHGPAMARSVLAVLYDRLGDREEAMRQLEMSYRPHLRPPFGVFAETPSNNRCYFITGAGAFLQALMEMNRNNR